MMQVAIPIIIMLIGFIPIIKYLIYIFFLKYKKTTGYIIDYKSILDSMDNTHYYHAIVEFSVNDHPYRCIDNHGNGYSTHKNNINAKMSIVYDPKDPSKCFVNHNIWNVSLIIIGIFIYILINYM